MKCRKCYKEICDDAVYCQYCGAKQSLPGNKRGNGQGTVYKRGGTWTAEVTKYVDGIRIRKKVGGFTTKRDATMAIPSIVDSLGARRTGSISFVELYRRVQETERYTSLSSGKKVQWKIAYNRCSALHGEKDFRNIRYEQMQDTVKGLPFYPARDVKVLLNAMSTLACKSDWADKNYAELIELPKAEHGEKIVFTDDQLSALWEHALVPDVDLILLMTYCGLRPVELRKLTPDKINLEERYMMAGQKTEHSKASPIAIPKALMPIAKKLKENGVPKMSEQDLLDRFYSALSACGIQDEDDHTISPVCCRHTYVTLLSKLGTNAAVIQKAARHTKYQTTLGYTHMDVSDVLSAVDGLPPSYHQ